MLAGWIVFVKRLDPSACEGLNGCDIAAPGLRDIIRPISAPHGYMWGDPEMRERDHV
jgi:hypothetical protein